jgi:hypothetical protein
MIKGGYTYSDPKKHHKDFRHRGIPKKLRILEDSFSIKTEFSKNITQLYQARNCLTHDLGIISQQRCNPNSEMILEWHAFDLLAKGEETGTVRPVAGIIGKMTEEETSIIWENVERCKIFKCGEKMILSKQDVWEICFFFQVHAIPSILHSFSDFLDAYGITKSNPVE